MIFYELVTTVARAYQKNPEVFKRVAEIVSMGGAIDAPGNTSPSAEFNVFADPYVPHTYLLNPGPSLPQAVLLMVIA